MLVMSARNINLQPVGDEDDDWYRVDELQQCPVLDEDREHSSQRLTKGEEDIYNNATEGTDLDRGKLRAW